MDDITRRRRKVHPEHRLACNCQCNDLCPVGSYSENGLPSDCAGSGQELMAGSSQGALPDGAPGVTLPAYCRAAAGEPTGAGDDSLLAALYMRMWALASGRPLPRNVPPGEMTEEELVNFWADDFGRAKGRHAAAAGGRR